VYTTFGKRLENRLRLICFPHAGGGAAAFRPWVGCIAGVDLIAAQLPGRLDRLGETPITKFDEMIDHLGIGPYTDGPYALFGHSMGGLLAYEIARRLCAIGLPPATVVASGVESPIAAAVNALRIPASPTEEWLLDEVKADSTVPGELLAQQEFRSLWLPILRADFSLCGDYRFNEPHRLLSVPTFVYYGVDDVPDPDGFGREWRHAVSAGVILRAFPGNHMFLETSQHLVLQQLTTDLAVMKPADD
jgi:surfactin synthase thioesterase subunit